MNAELRADPSLGHKQKGSPAMKKSHLREMRIDVHRSPSGKVTGHTVHHHMSPKSSGKSMAFMEQDRQSYPFGAGQHEEMMAHVNKHLGAGESMDQPASEGEQAQGEEAE
jgi:hypothetical protein